MGLRLLKWARNQSDWCPCKKRAFGYINIKSVHVEKRRKTSVTQEEVTIRKPGRVASVKHQACQRLALGLPASKL